MEQARKQQIAERIREVIDDSMTAAELAAKTGIHESYISRIKSGKWDEKHPSVAQWRKAESFLGMDLSVHFDSENYTQIIQECTRCKHEAGRMMIDGITGTGKTYALRAFERVTPNAHLITGRDSMSKRSLLHEVAQKLGVERFSTMGLYTLEKAIVEKIETRKQKTILLFDECEYLKPGCLHSIKTLSDLLEGKAAVVVAGIIEDEIGRRAERNKTGMPQFLRRFGSYVVETTPPKPAYIREAARAYGITEKETISEMVKYCKDYDKLSAYIKDHLKHNPEL